MYEIQDDELMQKRLADENELDRLLPYILGYLAFFVLFTIGMVFFLINW